MLNQCYNGKNVAKRSEIMNIKDVLSKIKKNHQDKSDIIFEKKIRNCYGQWLE